MGNQLHRIKNIIKNFDIVRDIKKALKAFSKMFFKIFKFNLSLKQTIAICSVLIVALVIILWPSYKDKSAISTINQIEQAIVDGNQTKIAKLINVDLFAANLAQAIVSQIESKKITQELLGYMQKELENKIVSDLYKIVENKGDFYQNINNYDAVLSKSLNFLINRNGKIIRKEVLEQDSYKAVIRLTIFRSDIDKEIDIDLVFKNNGYNWVLSNIQNISKVLRSLEEIEEERIAKLNKEIKENFDKFIQLKDFQKSDLNVKENSFLVRLSLENISNENILSLKGKLILSGNNEPLGVIDITVNDLITANNFYEKAWTIKLTDYESLKKIAAISSKNIKAELAPSEIVFEKGNVLKLIK